MNLLQISLGRSPDFVMHVGMQIVAYTCSLQHKGPDGSLTTIATLTHRSLIMLAKNASEIASSHLSTYKCRTLNQQEDLLEIAFSSGVSELTMTNYLRLDPRLQIQHRLQVIDNYGVYLNFFAKTSGTNAKPAP